MSKQEKNVKVKAGPDIVQTPEQAAASLADYQNNFMPNVHRTGRLTMACAFFFAFLPVFYFLVFKGYTLPFSNYLNAIIAIASIGIGMWLTEPLAYWPVLGSAGTYIAYLSGNVGGMRFPVALSVQSSLDADINTNRGQVATIIGIVASVFSNLVILLVIVLAGGWILPRLPQSVVASFSFVMPCLFGSMIIMRFNGKSGVVKGTLQALPYLATAVIVKLLITYVFTFMATYGTAISVGVTVLVAYIMFKVRTSKATTPQA